MNTIRWTRVLRRALLPVAILLGILLYVSYGTLTVPAGMDSMVETLPPGTVCVIQKRPGSVQPGSVVFVGLPDGSVLLSRVERVEAGRLWVRHDNEDSRLPDGEAVGPLPTAAVAGLVLSAFSSGSPPAKRDVPKRDVPGRGR